MTREEKKAWIERISESHSTDEFNNLNRELFRQFRYVMDMIDTGWERHMANTYGMESFNSTKPMCKGKEVTA